VLVLIMQWSRVATPPAAVTANEVASWVNVLSQNLRIGANWKSVVGPLAKAVTIQREGLARCSKVHA
jgi:hypothetical protein